MAALVGGMAGGSSLSWDGQPGGSRVGALVGYPTGHFALAADWPAALPGGAADQAQDAWLFWRQGRAAEGCGELAEVIFVGDVMMGRGVAGVETRNFASLLAGVAPRLAQADLAVGNFEGVIGELDEKGAAGSLGGWRAGRSPAGGPYRLAAPPDAAKELAAAGFDLMGVANNHIQDFGLDGAVRTVGALSEAGIEVVGADPAGDAGWPVDMYRPAWREINGVRLAFLAFNAVAMPGGPGRLPWSAEKALAAIAAARSQADGVVVSIHWGDEYLVRSGEGQRRLAQQMAEAGADLVVGHHPHVVQDTQVFASGGRARFAAYSLGNFVFDQYEERTRQGLALRAVFDAQGLRGVQALPAWAGPAPRWMAAEQAAGLVKRIRPPAQRIGFACDRQACTPAQAGQPGRGGIFTAGQIDLTGEGRPETVQREGERLRIYQDGALAWESPPEWQVVDAALGDPNDDGRGEVLLALRKPDGAGVMRSHPFIIGFRGGIYRQVWGGSAVADPILEVESGDVDGDGIQDLVVLEGRGAGRQAVTVWRWHGWGFRLDWRSAEGRYGDLALIPGPEGKLAINVGREW